MKGIEQKAVHASARIVSAKLRKAVVKLTLHDCLPLCAFRYFVGAAAFAKSPDLMMMSFEGSM